MRYVICAAVKYGDKIWLGKHHGDILQNMYKENPHEPERVDQSMQGFIGNHGEFLTRQEAAKMAFEAGQITEWKEGQILLSEEIQQKLWQINEMKDKN